MWRSSGQQHSDRSWLDAAPTKLFIPNEKRWSQLAYTFYTLSFLLFEWNVVLFLYLNRPLLTKSLRATSWGQQGRKQNKKKHRSPLISLSSGTVLELGISRFVFIYGKHKLLLYLSMKLWSLCYIELNTMVTDARERLVSSENSKTSGIISNLAAISVENKQVKKV